MNSETLSGHKRAYSYSALSTEFHTTQDKDKRDTQAIPQHKTHQLDRHIPNRSYQRYDDYCSNAFLTKIKSFSKHHSLVHSSLFARSLNENALHPALFFKKPQHYMIPSIPPKATFSIKHIRASTIQNIENNFYLNLLSWSSTDNLFLTVHKNQMSRIMSTPFHKPNQVTFFKNVAVKPGAIAAFGVNQVLSGWQDGSVRIDSLATPEHHIECFYAPHLSFINAIAPTGIHSAVLGGSGALNTAILQSIDFRTHPRRSNSFPISGKISGLAFNQEYYIAVGNNDNKVDIWDIRRWGQLKPMLTNTMHNSAVKGLAFDPHNSHHLISGGGSACRRLNLWTLSTNTVIQGPDTTSQITGVHFLSTNPHYLWTTHGFGKFYGVKLWRNTSSFGEDTFALQASFIPPININAYGLRLIYSAVAPEEPLLAGIDSLEELHFFKAIPPHARKNRLIERPDTRLLSSDIVPYTIR